MRSRAVKDAMRDRTNDVMREAIHDAPRELESERLRFRMFRVEDFPTYERWCQDIDIMRYLGGKTLDRNQAWRHMAYLLGQWELMGIGYYAIEDKATGTLVGRCGFTDSPGWPGFELGWTIAPENQRRGFAIEAATRLMTLAFDVLQKPHVMSLIHPDNAPSRRVAEKLGERIEGETEVLTMPVLIYGISADTWRALARQRGQLL
jgi:RimJ/RimL family protein N-acetyltransferase